VRKRNIAYILFVITLIGILGLSYLSQRSHQLTPCSESGFNPSHQKYYINPEKVVVNPWQGEHHVYAIFMIPGGHLNDRLFKVSISGFGTYCGILAFGGTTVAEGVYAKPGYYLMKALFPTRAAFWLISQGKGSQLEQPHNWILGYSKIR
jgi:hypothetical protein